MSPTFPPPTPVETTTSTVQTSASTVADDPVGPVAAGLDGWSSVELAEGVAAANEVMVWAGTELVFWGGEDDTSSGVPDGEPGLAYNPETTTWRTLPPSPMDPTFGAAGIWTGDEVIICCGSQSTAAAAYDPEQDSWRPLIDFPLRSSRDDYFEAVWTGSEMLVVAGGGVAGYDPTTDTWRTFSGAPDSPGRLNQIAWTGSELIVWPSEVERAVHRGLALDPKTGGWRILPDPPAWPAVPDIVWTGDQLIIWGGLPAATATSERAVGSRLDLVTNQWTVLPEPLPEPDGCECNLGGQTLLWAGRDLLVSTGHFGTGVDPSDALLLAYDPTNDIWTLVGESPAGGAEALMAGDRVVFLSDRLYLSEPGWTPQGSPIPDGGLAAVQMPPLIDVPGLVEVDAATGPPDPPGPKSRWWLPTGNRASRSSTSGPEAGPTTGTDIPPAATPSTSP